jgi:hypothetical protein
VAPRAATSHLGLRTQKSRATRYSPFFLVYGSEVVLASDIAFGAPRIQNYEEGKAKMTQHQDIDSVEEHRITMALQHARYEQQLGSTTIDMYTTETSTWVTWSCVAPVHHRRPQAIFSLGRAFHC